MVLSVGTLLGYVCLHSATEDLGCVVVPGRGVLHPSAAQLFLSEPIAFLMVRDKEEGVDPAFVIEKDGM